jgi:hypothetical protein
MVGQVADRNGERGRVAHGRSLGPCGGDWRQLDQRPVVSDGTGCAIGNELNLNKGERWLEVWISTLETLDSGNP